MKAFIRYVLIATVLAILIGAEWWMNSPEISRLTDNLPSKIRAVFYDGELQPWIMSSFLLYIATFIAIQLKQSKDAPDRWRLYCLAAVQGLAAINYYREPSSFGPQTIDALVFSGCCAVGLAFAFWISISSVPGRKLVKEIFLILVLLLAASSLYSGENWAEYHYRKVARATGIWRNPNTYGLLMGSGLVLAFIFLAEKTLNYTRLEPSKQTTLLKDKAELFIVSITFLLLLTGLAQSLSRGGWLGTAIALILLFNHYLNRIHNPKINATLNTEKKSKELLNRIHCNSKLITFLLISSLVLAFWAFRHNEYALVRRLFTTGNTTDFSWRNRASAYEQALQILSNKTFGLNSTANWEKIHDQYYKPLWQEDNAAIAVNDHLVLGIKNGHMAMFLFWSYLTLSLLPTSYNPIYPHTGIQLIGLSGSIILILGFWLDGGLYKLELATLFWLLMESAAAKYSFNPKIQPKISSQNENYCGNEPSEDF